jgi:SAM-dependent methyltransferase
MPPAARFFDDPRYLRTVVAEKPAAESAAQAQDAAHLTGLAGALDRREGALVLDAGCGHGRHAVPLARAGYRLVGLDRSPVLLAAARRAAGGSPWPRFVRGSYAKLPFAEEIFDAVLCLGSALGYLGEAGDRTALAEFRRVLAPGGRLVIETLHRDELGASMTEHEERSLARGDTLRVRRRFDRGRGLMHEEQSLDDGGRAGSPRAYEMWVYGEHELRRMVEDAGLRVVGRHASLAGEGEPSPVTPLVLVAEVEGGGRRASSGLRQ